MTRIAIVLVLATVGFAGVIGSLACALGHPAPACTSLLVLLTAAAAAHDNTPKDTP